MSQAPDITFGDGVRVKEELEIEPTVLQPTNVFDTTNKVEWDVEFEVSKPTSFSIKTENESDIDDESEHPYNELLTPECVLWENVSVRECRRDATGSQQAADVKAVITETSINQMADSVPIKCEVGAYGTLIKREPDFGSMLIQSRTTSHSQLQTTEVGEERLSSKVQPRALAAAESRAGDSLIRALQLAPKGWHAAAERGDTHGIRTHPGERPLESKIYNEVHPSYLTSHKLLHTANRPYECEICNTKFTDAGHLMAHKQTHTGETSFECEICNAKFTDAGHLKTHKRTHIGERTFECEICKSKFTKASTLKNHIRIHTGVKPFECETCSAKFTEAGHLKRHKRTHTGERPSECEICHAKFTQAGHLRRHKQTHTGNRPFECEICNTKFTEAGSLKRHKRTHTGERPFECEICNAKFTQAGHLRRHKQTHTGYKPFECEICNAKFIEAGSLKRHKRTHTGERSFDCEICNAKFIQASHLKKHKQIHRTN